jgi:antitoxin component HigA of HigAB toxin-antitoxin module
MTIKNENDYDQALSEIKSWLTKKDYNRNSFQEIEDVINAVETYMGMPLPAKNFILHNCLGPS